jgi:hypothetical protein
MGMRRFFLLAFLLLIGMAVLGGIAALILPTPRVSDEIIGTVVLAGLYSLGGLIAATVARSKRRLLSICLVTAGVSMTGFLAGIWLDGSIGWKATDWIMRISGSLVFPAIAMVHHMIFAPMSFRSGFARVNLRVALISAPLVAGILASLILLDEWYWLGELAVRIVGIAGIVASGSSVAAGVLWFLERRPEQDEPGLLGAGVPVELVCPRCGSMIRGRSNRECRCEGCRLKVRVEVEEPRCACGYLLYQLVGDVCPECGRAVGAEDRWAAPEGTGGAFV